MNPYYYCIVKKKKLFKIFMYPKEIQLLLEEKRKEILSLVPIGGSNVP